MREDIERFLAKKCKASIVLEMLLNREYVTGTDIINYYRDIDPDCKIPFTTCPQGLIKSIRRYFGYDFVKDEEIKFFRKFYTPSGKMYKVSDTYKKYFIDKCVGV